MSLAETNLPNTYEKINVMMGDVADYRRFIHQCAMKELKGFDKLIYVCSRWNGLLYRAVYDLRLKDVIRTKMGDVPVKNNILRTLMYVKIYGKIFWYDNQRERVKFKKWVKTR